MKPLIKINDQTRIATKSDGTKMPVVDAKFNILIQPSPEDIQNGVPGDHANCMYCLACRRQFGSELVWVTRSLAYVELKSRGGYPELQRFILAPAAKTNVAQFDKNKTAVMPEAVVFAAPTGSHTLDSKRKAWNAWNKSHSRKAKAYLVGDKSRPGSKRIKPFAETLRDKATGKFQFHAHSASGSIDPGKESQK